MSHLLPKKEKKERNKNEGRKKHENKLKQQKWKKIKMSDKSGKMCHK